MSTSTSTPTGVRTALPKVNLLPTEISEGAKFRNLQAALGLSIVLALGVIGVLSYLASGEASDAQAQVESAQAQTTTLQAEVASYAAVPKLYAQVALANAQLARAMDQEIRFSFVLNDLSLTIPSTVTLGTMTILQPVDAPGSILGSWGNNGQASITFHGQTKSFTDVAGWLDSLAKTAYYSDPYVTLATRVNIGEQPFSFDSTVLITSKAFTNRYSNKAGS